MNKKYNGLMAGLMLFSATGFFASEANKAADAARYDEIVKAFNARKLKSDNIEADIKIVENHKKDLEIKFAAEKKVVDASYAPSILNIVGGSLAAAAAIGGIASLFSAGAASIALNSPENEGRLIEFKQELYSYPERKYYSGYPDDARRRAYDYATEKTIQEEVARPESSQIFRPRGETVRGSKYLETVKSLFGGFVSTSSALGVTREYLRNMPQNKALIMFGLEIAPVVGMGSLIFAGVSKYLFNKAASYKNEMIRLEKEIKRDEAIIKALEALNQ